MVRAWVALAIMLPACGRIGFDISGDSGDGGAGASYAATVLADGPYAYYRLGDALGAATLRDSSGNNRHAESRQSSGGEISPRPGALAGDPNTATRFLGEGNTGTGGIGLGLFPAVWPLWSGDFTIEAFVDTLSQPPGGYAHSLVICETYLADGFRIGWNIDGKIEVWSDEAGGGDAMISVGSLRSGWTHLAIVQRGGTIQVFFDGVSDGVSTFMYFGPTGSAECGFGSFHGMECDVILDELAIYDVGLTGAQIAAHYAASGR